MNDNSDISISPTKLTLQKDDCDSQYVLSICNCENPTSRINVALSEPMIEQFIVDWRQLQSDRSAISPDKEANAQGDLVEQLSRITDQTLQHLLRMVQLDELLSVLWYLKDLDFANNVIRNMSVTAANMLIDDLEGKFSGINPSHLPQDDNRVIFARQSLNKILGIANELASERSVSNEDN